MTRSFKFDCYKSILGGWVASGTIQGLAGSAFEGRPVWYGCQGDTWADLQAGMARLVESLSQRVDPRPRLNPIEALVKAWPEDKPMLVPPVGSADKLFRNIIQVGSRRRGLMENVDGVKLVSFLKLGGLALVLPEGEWKPELVGSFLEFTIGLVPEHPTPAPGWEGQTPADLIEEILLGGKAEPRA